LPLAALTAAFFRNPAGHDTSVPTLVLSVKFSRQQKYYRRPKNEANKKILRSEERGLHSHSLQRDFDTGGTPARCCQEVFG